MFDKLKQLKQMRDQAMQIQKQLDEKIIEVEKKGVMVQITGAQRIKSISTNGKSDSDIAEAINEAIKESQKIAAKEMQGMMGGMDAFKGLMGS
ncbi:MAG TPA: YbaB/EbfC family nucleoid-associated protein [Patescibacteria group bacterium]